MAGWQDILTGAVGILPAILQFIEIIHPRKSGQAPQGAVKQGAAVNLAQTALITAAAAGAIPASDAQNLTAITELVDSEVKRMQSQGQLGGLKSAPGGPALVNSPKAQEPPLFVAAPVAKPAQEVTPILDSTTTSSGSTGSTTLNPPVTYPTIDMSKVMPK